MEKGDTGRLERVMKSSDLADIHFVRQGEPKGLGHAVLRARTHVGDSSFAVLLGDDLIDERDALLTDMIAEHERSGAAVIALMEVDPANIHMYGAAAVEPLEGSDAVRVTGLVEKPAQEDAPSNLAVIGRYVLPASVFDILEHTEPGKGGEIQLTDALQVLATDPDGPGVVGVIFGGRRYDTGDRVDYIKGDRAARGRQGRPRSRAAPLAQGVRGTPLGDSAGVGSGMDLAAGMRHGPIELRLVRAKDARPLQHELLANRSWLQPWEATVPYGSVSFDMRLSIRRLLQQYRDGSGYPFVMEYDGEVAGQLNVWGVSRGSLCSATIGVLGSERFAGRGITPTAVRDGHRRVLHRVRAPPDGDSASDRRTTRVCASCRSWGSVTRDCVVATSTSTATGATTTRFALTREDVPQGVLARWLSGQVPPDAATVPPSDRISH